MFSFPWPLFFLFSLLLVRLNEAPHIFKKKMDASLTFVRKSSIFMIRPVSFFYLAFFSSGVADRQLHVLCTCATTIPYHLKCRVQNVPKTTEIE